MKKTLKSGKRLLKRFGVRPKREDHKPSGSSARADQDQPVVSTEEVSSRTWGKVIGGMEQALELARGVVEGFAIPGAAPAIGLALSVVGSIRVRTLLLYSEALHLIA